MSVKFSNRAQEPWMDISSTTQYAYMASLAGFYDVPVFEYVPLGKVAVLQGVTTVDGQIILDGRMGTL